MSRELLIFGIAFAAGLLVVPPLIWLVGNRMLGPYTHGADTRAGPFALLEDFFIGLGQGAITYWLVALGPAIMILLIRLFVAALRYRPQTTPPRH